jgi:D-lactate dehydrogenase (cytochrome)
MNAPTHASHVLPAVNQRTTPPALIDALKAKFGERCSTALAVREHHGKDESAFTVPPPSAVVFAESTADVAAAVKLAAQYKTPVIPFGVGSSLEGHLLAVQGGISIDVSRMNQVLRINAEDLTVTVQPGVTRKAVNEAVKSEGLFFPIDPGADASIGGMSASGDVIRTGTRAKKSSAGYDLTRLMVGSEGTLGVITEISLKLYPLPEAISAAVCSFPSIEAAVRTTIQIIQMGIPIARVELIDSNSIRMVNAYSKLTLEEAPMLLMEFHGSPASVKEQAELVQEIAAEHGGRSFDWATTPEARTKLWTARHNAYFAGMQSKPGCRVISTDTCVPISKLADCLLESVAEADASGIPYFLVGHVGDGNFHFGYLIDPTKPEERETAETLNDKLVARALRLEGTCTGEHGVGLHKMDFLKTETGLGAVDMMRTIKHALDPDNIMNPGKIFSW